MLAKFGKRRKKGFTLIEILIYTAIIGIILTSFVAFSVSIANVRNKTYVVQEVQANSRLALDIISQKIRQAVVVITPAEGGSGASLELDMPDPNPNLIFNLSGGVLNMTEGAGPAASLTSNEVYVYNLVFTNMAQGGKRANVKIDISIRYNSASDVEYTFSQDVRTAVSQRP